MAQRHKQKKEGRRISGGEDQHHRAGNRFYLRASPLHAVAKQIQAKVKEEVEGMTGLFVGGVDVYVQELQLPEPGKD